MRPELIVHKNPKSPNSEIFRTLRTNIQFMNVKKKIKTLLVTSTFPAEGKSWVASNLAVTFAQAGQKVIVIDADMRKGRQYRIFEVAPKPGLSNYLSDAEIDDNGKSSVDIAGYIQETEIENLYVLPAGNVPPNPSELLVSPQMIGALEDLKKICDLVIIDGTPCELVADSIILSRIVDCTVIVAAYKITKKDALDRVIKNIQNVGGNLVGVVMNKYAVSKKYNQQYYYYGDTKKKNKKSFGSEKGTKGKRVKSKNDVFEDSVTNYYKNTENTQANEEKDTPVQQETVHEEITHNIEKTENNSYINDQNPSFNTQIDSETSFLDKTNEIMKQINDYLNEQKNNMN